MFNSTHTLAGLALARTGLDRWAPHAAWTAVIAANLPDIDCLALLRGTSSYIEYHRGITHTLIGVPALAFLLAIVMWAFTGDFRRTFVVAFVAAASHPLLDYGNSYGVRPFAPWNPTWYYGDTLFIIDPLLDLILTGGLFAAARFESRRKLAAWSGICLALAYAGTRIELRDISREHLGRFTASIPEFQRSAVLPQMLDPFAWSGIVETDKEIFSVAVDVFRGVTGETGRMSKDGPAIIVERAGAAESARVFQGFARFPVVKVEAIAAGYRVLMADFRFNQPASGAVFGTQILLDKSLRVIGEEMGFGLETIRGRPAPSSPPVN